jgi:hypothetical protein
MATRDELWGIWGEYGSDRPEQRATFDRQATEGALAELAHFDVDVVEQAAGIASRYDGRLRATDWLFSAKQIADGEPTLQPPPSTAKSDTESTFTSTGQRVGAALALAAIAAVVVGGLLALVTRPVLGRWLEGPHANGAASLIAVVAGTLVAVWLATALVRDESKPQLAPVVFTGLLVAGSCTGIGSSWIAEMDPETATLPWNDLPAAAPGGPESSTPTSPSPRPTPSPQTTRQPPTPTDSPTPQAPADAGASTGEWWRDLPQPVGSCLRDFHDAPYLSATALQAATCVVDEAFFGGVPPTEDITRNVTGELLFHATWATWSEAERDVYCGMVDRGGFDAAEDIGISLARTWRDQIRAAGSNMALDDYAMVLDVLDTCNERA